MEISGFASNVFRWPITIFALVAIALADAQSPGGQQWPSAWTLAPDQRTATSMNKSATLTYIPGSSVKLYQINGDCDWPEWDATNTNPTPTCKPTASQTATRADVLGDDVATSFENNGKLIMMFGDTIGATDDFYPTYIDFQNTFAWDAHDPIARGTTQKASDGLLLNFFLRGNHALEVLPPPQPDGTPVYMGAFDVPDAGVSLNGQIYISAKTGHTANSDTSDYAVLVKFDEGPSDFFFRAHDVSTSGRAFCDRRLV
jgi:hypothetical protein